MHLEMSTEDPRKATRGGGSFSIVKLSVESSTNVTSREEMRSSYLRQYRRAAEKGEVSFAKYWRLVRELDRVALAEVSGLTAEVIEEAERGGGPARLDRQSLLALASALRVPPEFLV